MITYILECKVDLAYIHSNILECTVVNKIISCLSLILKFKINEAIRNKLSNEDIVSQIDLDISPPPPPLSDSHGHIEHGCLIFEHG